MQVSLILLYGCLHHFLVEARPSWALPEAASSAVMPKTEASIAPNDPAYYNASQTALLFLDYQNILFDMITDANEKNRVLASAKKLLATARKRKVPIIHCIIDTKIDPPPTSKIREQWFEVNKPILEADPELALIYPDLAPPKIAPRDRYESVSKRPPGPRSAFVNNDLLADLRNRLGVTSLILGGIATSGAVAGTALQGVDLNFVVTVVEQAVWDPNEQVGNDLLGVVFPVLGYVASTEQAIGYMEKS